MASCIITSRTLALGATLALLLGACGSAENVGEVDVTVLAGSTTAPDDATTPDDSRGTPTDTTTSTGDTDSGDTGTGTGDTADGSATSSPTALPGEPFDHFARPGDVLAVVGVAHDDELNVRARPGTDQAVVATADPDADNLVATGRARLLPSSIWYEVEVDGATGWVSISFVAYAGVVDDATAELTADQPPLGAATMVELGQAVADLVATDDPPSRVIQSGPASEGDLGEVTFDVVGIGDDAVAGFRLHIFGTPSDGGDEFFLKSVERTTYCWRGLTGKLCS